MKKVKVMALSIVVLAIWSANISARSEIIHDHQRQSQCSVNNWICNHIIAPPKYNPWSPGLHPLILMQK